MGVEGGCNSEKFFYSVHANLLSMKGDSFLRTLRSLIQKVCSYWRILMIFCEITCLRKEIAHIKNINHGKSSYFDSQLRISQIFGEIFAHLKKKKIGRAGNFKIWTSKKVHISLISREFCDFRRNNNAFMQNNRTFKKYYPQGKFAIFHY